MIEIETLKLFLCPVYFSEDLRKKLEAGKKGKKEEKAGKKKQQVSSDEEAEDDSDGDLAQVCLER